MKTFNRRQFLRLAGAGASALAVQQLLAACGIMPSGKRGTDSSTVNTPILGVQATQTPTPVPPGLVLVHGKDPESLLRKGLQAIGGLEKFVKTGANVIIKPNICAGYRTYEYAATTNPYLVGALVKLCLEAGAGRVRVMDYPFGGPAKQCYEISGIAEQVTNAGGEMEVMQQLKFKKTPCPAGVVRTSFDVYEDILTADTVINVPVAKNHSAATLTLSMKNLMGTVNYRERLHDNLHESIADLTTLVVPTLTVLDAIRIMLEHGPTGGDLNDVKTTDSIALSTDMVTVDTWATSLFGKTPADVPYVQKAINRGLGVGDLTQVKIEEINADA